MLLVKRAIVIERGRVIKQLYRILNVEIKKISKEAASQDNLREGVLF